MSAHTNYHVFLSYAREDNQQPVNQAGEGWVSAFRGELERRHAAYSGRSLKVFFDQMEITGGRDARRELGKGIRESRHFLAFLSPHYITSPNCLWGWNEYLRREHSAARGMMASPRSTLSRPAISSSPRTRWRRIRRTPMRRLRADLEPRFSPPGGIE